MIRHVSRQVVARSVRLAESEAQMIRSALLADARAGAMPPVSESKASGKPAGNSDLGQYVNETADGTSLAWKSEIPDAVLSPVVEALSGCRRRARGTPVPGW